MSDAVNDILETIEKTKTKYNCPQKVALMAVSKTRSVEEILTVVEKGLVLFGENRVQEAHQKYTDSRLRDKAIDLHFLGHLQRNKIKKVLEISDTIQSIDKLSTITAVNNECEGINKKVDFLIEVNTTGEESKYGVSINNYQALLDEIMNADLSWCRLRGLMTVGPLTDNTKEIQSSFALLRNLFEATKREVGRENFDILSMGMSNDYEIAIKEGSTMVRVGTALFGKRKY